jgi:hypothetical protein
MRGRAAARLRAAMRGIVSDAALHLVNGVICDLSFKIIRYPMEDCWHYSTSFRNLSIPFGGFRALVVQNMVKM